MAVIAPISYSGIHTRLKRWFGPAKDYLCSFCDLPAHCWSWDHSDPDPVFGSTGDGRAAFYSVDVRFYTPTCWSCARIKDQTPDGWADFISGRRLLEEGH